MDPLTIKWHKWMRIRIVDPESGEIVYDPGTAGLHEMTRTRWQHCRYIGTPQPRPMPCGMLRIWVLRLQRRAAHHGRKAPSALLQAALQSAYGSGKWAPRPWSELMK